MHQFKFFFLVILLSNIASKSNAQFKHPLIIGIGTNFIDSDLRTFEFYNFDEWNYVVYPSRIHIEQKIFYGFSLEAIASVNRIRSTSFVDGNFLPQLQAYHAMDLLLKVPLSSFIEVHKYLDFFVHGGYGFASFTGKSATVRPDLLASSYNTSTYLAGLGLNTWVAPRFGINLQTTAKFVSNKQVTPHMQHSIACVYKIGEENTASKPKFLKRKY
jgi:hypothetical protein